MTLVGWSRPVLGCVHYSAILPACSPAATTESINIVLDTDYTASLDSPAWFMGDEQLNSLSVAVRKLIDR